MLSRDWPPLVTKKFIVVFDQSKLGHLSFKISAYVPMLNNVGVFISLISFFFFDFRRDYSYKFHDLRSRGGSKGVIIYKL